jgi:hypothetical protein
MLDSASTDAVYVGENSELLGAGGDVPSFLGVRWACAGVACGLSPIIPFVMYSKETVAVTSAKLDGRPY